MRARSRESQSFSRRATKFRNEPLCVCVCVCVRARVGEHGCRKKQQASDGGLYVADCGSAHGTKLNKAACPAHKYVELRDGDVLMFGASTRLFAVHGSGGAAKRAAADELRTVDAMGAFAVPTRAAAEKRRTREKGGAPLSSASARACGDSRARNATKARGRHDARAFEFGRPNKNARLPLKARPWSARRATLWRWRRSRHWETSAGASTPTPRTSQGTRATVPPKAAAFLSFRRKEAVIARFLLGIISGDGGDAALPDYLKNDKVSYQRPTRVYVFLR